METIVSFSIIMLMLALVGTVIVASINMTARSALVAGQLEAAAQSVEKDAGTEVNSARLVISRVAEGGTIMPNPIYIDLTVKQSDDEKHMLTYFSPVAQQGGGAGG